MSCPSLFGVVYQPRYVAWFLDRREWRSCGSADTREELQRWFGDRAVILRAGEVPSDADRPRREPAAPRQDGPQSYRFPHGGFREQMEAGAVEADDGQAAVEDRWRRWAERE